MILRLLRAGLRRVFNLSFLAALSLLLFIGLGCLWARSMRVSEWLSYTRSSGHQVFLGTQLRRFGFTVFIPWGVPRTVWSGWDYDSYQSDTQDLAGYLAMTWKDSWLGFKLIRYDCPYQGGGLHVTVGFLPLWFPMVLTLIAPLCWLRRWRRQARRVRLGLCLHCGYDLRASTERCPECGAPVHEGHVAKVTP